VLEDDDKSDEVTALAALSHEVHQPLTYLIASLDSLRHSLLASTVDGAEQLRLWIDRASASAKHIGKLVSDAGPVYSVARAQRLDLATVVGSTLDIVVAEVERRARLERQLSPGICVFTDETRLRQVVLNLVMNAWLSLPDREAAGAHVKPARHRIIVRVEELSSRAIIEVEDDGSGVTDELLSRVAAPYFTTLQQGRALGLGLAICKRIVHGCGGVIEFARGRHGGTVVRAVIPACAEQNEEQSG
jgi:signal transduction histidine kinase